MLDLHLDGDDGEAEATSVRPTAFRIQKRLSEVIDEPKVAELRKAFMDADALEDVLRLDELQDEHQEHTWIWALNPVTEPVLPEADWQCAARLKLGCPQLSSEMVCNYCGEKVLDRQGYHALCCAVGESTKGHNAVRDGLHAGFIAVDPGAATEVVGLIPSQPDLRPADVLTSATRAHGSMAVDVGICAPHASGAGDNCVENMRAHKFEHYANVLRELERENIEYLPATISCYGRRHPSVTQILIKASQAAARRRGVASHKAIFRR